jgi:hypothetical protein
VASDDRIVRLEPNGKSSTFKLKGRYNPLLHSVHFVDNESFGAVDTGNSAVRIIDKKGNQTKCFTPLHSWGNPPCDAIHLNDFVVTPYGLLASCFDYRPWRAISTAISPDDWHSGGYGVILNLSGGPRPVGAGRIVGCGFNHPHSLSYIEPNLYLCSSTTGTFSVCSFNKNGTLFEKSQFKVTNDHFLRGACYSNGSWFLGGSTNRHGKVISENVEIYHLTPSSGNLIKKEISGSGEIYDILPWRDEIMTPILHL